LPTPRPPPRKRLPPRWKSPLSRLPAFMVTAATDELDRPVAGSVSVTVTLLRPVRWPVPVDRASSVHAYSLRGSTRIRRALASGTTSPSPDGVGTTAGG